MSIFEAATSGNVQLVKQILETKQGVLDKDEINSALNRSACGGYLEISKLLVNYGADVNSRGTNQFGMTPLDCAIENMHLDIMQFLIECGADLNTSDEYGQTPLHRAVDIEMEESINTLNSMEPSTRITELLIRNGADVSSQDFRGKTPLDWAIDRGHKAAEKILKKKLNQS